MQFDSVTSMNKITKYLNKWNENRNRICLSIFFVNGARPTVRPIHICSVHEIYILLIWMLKQKLLSMYFFHSYSIIHNLGFKLVEIISFDRRERCTAHILYFTNYKYLNKQNFAKMNINYEMNFLFHLLQSNYLNLYDNFQ